MTLSKRPRLTLSLEHLEDRLNPAPVLLNNLTIPGSGSAWDYSLGPHNGAAVVADLNNDGRDDVLAPGGDGNLYAFEFNPNSNQMNPTPRLFSLGSQTAQIQCTPIVIPLPGGARGVFVGVTNGLVFGWNAATGALLPGWPKTVATPLSITAEGVQIFGSMASTDLDKDGSPEILCTSFNHELTAFRLDGSVMWRFNDDDTVFTGITIGDLNNDGSPEVIAGGDSTASQFYWDGGRVNCLSALGRRVWVKRTDQVIWSSPALADIDGNGRLDVIIGTGYFLPPPPTNGPYPGNLVYALDASGNDLPGWPYVTGPSTQDARPYSSPAFADLNGDGNLEVVIADGSAQLHAIRPNGTALWKVQAFAAQNLYTSPIIADFNGTGLPSVLIAAAGNIRAFAGATGNQIYAFQDNQPHYTAASIGHIRGNASFQMAIVGNSLTQGGALLSPSFLQVFDLDATTLNPPWGQFRQDFVANSVARPVGTVTGLINQLYANVRNRQPTAGELTFNQAIFSRAGTLKDAINTILVNPETRGVVVDGLYQTWLNRLPDPGGRTVWVNFLGSNRTYAQAAVEFASSNEAFVKAGNSNSNFVISLYRNILKRPTDPSQSEVNGWVDFLVNRGVSRLALAGFFAISTEATNRTVFNYYATYAPGNLATPPSDALAQAGWDLRRGKQEEQLLADILTSAGDYATTGNEGSFVRAAYQDMLRRTPSVGEVGFWIDSFERGTQSFQSFATILTRAPEYLTILVNGYYQLYLGRSPGAAEATQFVNQLSAGVKRETVIRSFVTSNEYFALAQNNNTNFINKAFQDLLGHLPDANQLAFWQARGNAVRTDLPQSVLFGAPNEFYQVSISDWFYRLYRRLPSTQSDSSRLIPQGTPFAEQALANSWAAGTLPGDIQAGLLTRTEYFTIARTKAFWLGSRWLDVRLI